MTVQRILDSKGTSVPTVLPDATIDNVIALLEAEDSGALVVSGDGKAIEGIISDARCRARVARFRNRYNGDESNRIDDRKGLYLQCE